jgi:hypothetical protein
MLDFAIIGVLSLARLKVVIDQYLVEAQGPYESIAVLPFTNLSGDPDQEYVAAALGATVVVMQHVFRLTPQELDLAGNDFEQAMTEDRASARALAGLGLTWAERAQTGIHLPQV